MDCGGRTSRFDSPFSSHALYTTKPLIGSSTAPSSSARRLSMQHPSEEVMMDTAVTGTNYSYSTPRANYSIGSSDVHHSLDSQFFRQQHTIGYPESSQRTVVDHTPYTYALHHNIYAPQITSPTTQPSSHAIYPRVERPNLFEPASGVDTLSTRADSMTGFSAYSDASVDDPPVSIDDPDESTAYDHMVNVFKVGADVDSSQQVAESQLVTPLCPSMLTFQLSVGTWKLIQDPDSDALLASFVECTASASEGSEDWRIDQWSETDSLDRDPITPWSRTSFSSAVNSSLSFPDISRVHAAASPPGTSTVVGHAPLPSAAMEIKEESPPNPRPRKAKMHECVICHKLFPRPSGLDTHMNSHSGAKPFKCPIPGCNKDFAVRSNAKRHLRTHGITPSEIYNTPAKQYKVGFEPPTVSDVVHPGMQPTKLRWVPQSLATRTNIDWLRSSPPPRDDSGSLPELPLPLHPVVPSVIPSEPGHEEGEERNSYAANGDSPYHPSQWRGRLPGPAATTSTPASA